MSKAEIHNISKARQWRKRRPISAQTRRKLALAAHERQAASAVKITLPQAPWEADDAESSPEG